MFSTPPRRKKIASPSYCHCRIVLWKCSELVNTFPWWRHSSWMHNSLERGQACSGYHFSELQIAVEWKAVLSREFNGDLSRHSESLSNRVLFHQATWAGEAFRACPLGKNALTVCTCFARHLSVRQCHTSDRACRFVQTRKRFSSCERQDRGVTVMMTPDEG